MITPAPAHDISSGLQIEPLPAFSDNYLWLIHDGKHAAVVDPGDADVVLNALQVRQLTLRAILITHHHPDHIGGLQALKAATGATVYGPAAEASRIAGLDHLLADGDSVRLDAPSLTLTVLAVPGHTLGHIVFYAVRPEPGLLFCGDTLFSGGCGRLFEGSAEQMRTSLSRLAQLPPATAVYCAHEYTLANLRFAAAVEPDNPDIAAALAQTLALRGQQLPTLPSSLAREARINPFLRWREPAVAAAVAAQASTGDTVTPDIFAALRKWKDGFRAPAN